MIVTIHQPDFLPWLGFFDRWKRSQRYVVLDDAQFIRRGWQHRDKIKTPGGVQWLTLPVQKKGNFTQAIRDVRLEEGLDWRGKHLRTIRSCYGKAPHFERHFAFLERAYLGGSRFLMEFNLLLLEYAAGVLGIDTPLCLASTFGSGELRATRRLVELTRLAGGDVYLTGVGSRDYLDEAAFRQQGIAVAWQAFEHPIYPQLHGPFEPGLSVLDYLMLACPVGSAGEEAPRA